MTLASLFARAAAAAPSSPALIGADHIVTWSDADRISASVADHLMKSGVGQGDRIAVARLKGPESYLAVHAILRAGAVVVPIDPLAPAHHGREVLRNADVSAVIADSRTAAILEPDSVEGLHLKTVVVDGATVELGQSWVGWSDVAGSTDVHTLPEVRANDPAYIIYTSGSTGTPKGIVHTHRSAMAYAKRAADAHLRPTDRLAGISGFHYDMSTLELYAAPLAMVPVVVMGEAHLRFPASFLARSAIEGVTAWYAVTSMLRQVVECGAAPSHDHSALRSIMYAGEPYPPGALRSLWATFPEVEMVNVYGPAEVNECSFHVLAAPPGDDDDIPVGPVWSGAEALVVDETGAAVADGDMGELWVSTPTVMDGYWRQPVLTAQSLHVRPDLPPWYATGDLVSIDAEGIVWFKGRADNQIKLRGMRVELEGIEAVVADAPGVVHAVVGPDQEGIDASQLLASVVIADGHAFDENAIRAFCTARLAAPFVPRSVVPEVEFPFTTSGKIDRTAVRRSMREASGRSRRI